MSIKKRVSGFSLLEVLISLFILVVGLLGMANLQLVSLQASAGAYQRSQAAILVSELSERIRANPDGVAAGDYLVNDWDDWLSTTSCSFGVDCSTSLEIAQNDLYRWRRQIHTNFPGAVGSVYVQNGIHIVKLIWSEQVYIDRLSANPLDAANDGVEIHEYSLPVIP